MVEINLLPWRAYMREYVKKRNLRRFIICLVMCALSLVTLHGGLSYKLYIENHRVHQLQKQLSTMDRPSKHVSPDIESLQVILKRFQHNQREVINFFEQLMQLTPEDIVWKSILSQDEQVILTGNTSSLQALLEFIKPFDGVKNSLRAEVMKIKTLPHSDVLQFSVQFFQAITPLPNTVEKQHE